MHIKTGIIKANIMYVLIKLFTMDNADNQTTWNARLS